MRCLNPRANININDMHLRTEVLNRELESAAGRGAVERMQQLIAAGADTSKGKARLMSSAIYSGKPATVAFLKRLGLPLGGMGRNPLNDFSYRRDVAGLAMVEYLLKQGVNPNHTNASGNTPLRDAIQSSNEKMVALLLRYHANPNVDMSVTGLPLPLHRQRPSCEFSYKNGLL